MDNHHQHLWNPDPVSEYKFIPICVEINSSVMLMVGINQMYFGIEIRHPVYGILFGNLIVALVSSLLNIFVLPFVSEFKYSTLVNGNNITYLVFYLSCWLVLSVLRYAYIIKTNWLHENFTEAKTILLLAYFGVVSVFTLCISSVLGTLMSFGWPAIKAVDMETRSRAICVSIIVGNFILLLGSSCIFYIAILRKRGKLGKNKITSLNVTQNNGISASQTNRIPTPSVFLIENPPINEAFDDIPDQLQIVFETKEQERLRTEINASIRSLETNIVLAVLFIVTFLVAAIFSDSTSLIILTLLKGATPILSTMANFVKIQQLFVSYWIRMKATVLCSESRLM